MRVDPKEGGKSFPKLTQEDLESDAVVLTIGGYEQRRLPSGDLVRELYFRETDKPLRLNRTTVGYLIEGLGSDDTDKWTDCIVPVEKKDTEGPDGKVYAVVWVSPPESWAGLFREADMTPPKHQRPPITRTVKAAAKVKAAPAVPVGRPVRKLGNKRSRKSAK